ncbi:MAG: hypothetical protein ACD_24C00402G0001 [uncultured bacterium]|nr:MAG: hypothetical protein ACD_24C00402G0001 [uncultured bacterium]
MVGETSKNKGRRLNLSKYRYVFCDLDHTIASFIDGKLYIPTTVVTAINDLDAEIGFSISTARCLEEIYAIEGISNIIFRSPLILENGATIVTSDFTVIKQHVLTENVAVDLVEYLKKFDIWKKVCIAGKLLDFDNVDHLSKLTKIALQDLTEDMLKEIFEKLSSYSNIAYFRSKAAHKSGTFTLDITNIQATKQNGVFTVLELAGVGRDKAIGIGDSDNDFPMLEACGLKVAVANAKPSILDIADLIVPSCDHEGVAQLLPKLGKKI